MKVAKEKLADAEDISLEDFPALVVDVTYQSMHFAAMAVLQVATDWSPIRRNEVVAEFGKLVSVLKDKNAVQYGKDLNYVFDKRVVADYGEIGEEA